jgi:hypothetical protein
LLDELDGVIDALKAVPHEFELAKFVPDKVAVSTACTTCKTEPTGMFALVTALLVLGIAFNTELTKKLSVTTESPTVQALARTTVVPVVAV